MSEVKNMKRSRLMNRKGSVVTDSMVVLLVGLLLFIVLGSLAGKFVFPNSGGSVTGNVPVKPNNGGGLFSKAVTVEVDAAFGGDQKGYEGIVCEAEVSESVASLLVKYLENDSNFKVVRTHQPGEAMSVTSRAEKIRKDNPKIVLSIRADGHPDRSQSGMKVYHEIPQEKAYTDTIVLAKEIATQFTEEKWKPETGYLYYSPLADGSYEMKFVESDDTADYQLETWDLMKLSDKPVVIVDLFKVTNESDVKKWANEEGYASAAEKLYKALCTSYGFEPKPLPTPTPETPSEEKGSTNE